MKRDKDAVAKATSKKIREAKLLRAAKLKERYEEETAAAEALRMELLVHPLQDEIEALVLEREWHEGVEAKEQERTRAGESKAVGLDKRAGRLLGEAEELRRQALDLQVKAEVLRQEAERGALAASRKCADATAALGARLKEVRKRFRQVTHKADKRAREAEARAVRALKQFGALRAEILLQEKIDARQDNKGEGVQRDESQGPGEAGGGSNGVVEGQPRLSR
jgi:hypothetical protein